MTALTVGSLFTGIGGLDLGLERAGMTVRWQSEIDPYCCRVLARHWPDTPNLGDVTTIDWRTVEPVDLICGGYPCQPFSLAGTRSGAADARHLWPRFADALRHLRPRYALLENVPGHLSLGFGRVLGDLAEIGFDAEWDCIGAADVGAPHLRKRIFVVAHAQCNELRQQPVAVFGRSSAPVARDDGAQGCVADADSIGRQPRRDDAGQSQVAEPVDRRAHVADAKGVSVGPGLRPSWPRGERWGRPGDGGSAFDVAHPAGGGRDREPRRTGAGRDAAERSETIHTAEYRSASLGEHWAAEPDVGRVADGVPARVDRLRALGNAVVPQVAEYVGRRIMDAAS